MYRWTKVWAVQTSADDETEAGDIIAVEASSGDSKQLVLSKTEMHTKSGKPYFVLLTQEAS